MNIYSISNLDEYASSVRDAVAQTFTENYTDNLDDYITIEQTKFIISGYSLGQDDDGLLIINEDVFNEIFDDIRQWFYESGLSKLASQDVLDCAWDEKTDQMIFWVKDNNNFKSTK